MDSTKKGFRRMRHMAFRKMHGQQTSQRNSTDLSRAMVVMNQQGNQSKSSINTRQALIDLLGTLVDEKA